MGSIPIRRICVAGGVPAAYAAGEELTYVYRVKIAAGIPAREYADV